jgi:general secretion pathway protein A
MYNAYFGFAEAPFSIAPDPRYLFMSERHREALAHLLFGVRTDGGFVLLTGEVGTGKTTVCRCLLEQLPGNCDVAFIFNPKLSAVELLLSICEELHIPVSDRRLSVKVFVDLLNFHLLESNARGRKTVLIIDEAQNLSSELLEQLRLLTNLETNQRKLLQIILLGQPELRQRLSEPGMRQLAQRIVARYHLQPLSRAETAAYVNHRLGVAGVRHALFPGPVLERIFRLSRGTPRLINVLCDRALLGAYVEGQPVVTPATLAKAAAEVLGDGRQPLWSRPWSRWVLALLGVSAMVVGVGMALRQRGDGIRVGDGGAPAVVHGPTGSPGAGAAPAPAPVATLAAVGAVGDVVVWPADKDPWLHEAFAVRGLYKLWQLDLPVSGAAAVCAQAREAGLQCLAASGDMARLRCMNTPAIVDMRQPAGPDFLATLVALDGQRAHLLVAGEPRAISAAAFERQWSGRYTVLWRGPPGGFKELVPGMGGSAVAWVDDRLAHWAGQPGSTGKRWFDAGLKQRVLEFQKAMGIEADGVVGSCTMIRLAQSADASAPSLGQR